MVKGIMINACLSRIISWCLLIPSLGDIIHFDVIGSETFYPFWACCCCKFLVLEPNFPSSDDITPKDFNITTRTASSYREQILWSSVFQEFLGKTNDMSFYRTINVYAFHKAFTVLDKPKKAVSEIITL